jgi:hypothetical protein
MYYRLRPEVLSALTAGIAELAVRAKQVQSRRLRSLRQWSGEVLSQDCAAILNGDRAR